MKHHHRKCHCCKKWFTTDPRNHHHQRFCTQNPLPESQQERRAKNSGNPNRQTGTSLVRPGLKWSESGRGASCIRSTGSDIPRTPKIDCATRFHRCHSHPSAIMDKCFPAFGRDAQRNHETKQPARTMSTRHLNQIRNAPPLMRAGPSKHPQFSIGRQMSVIRKYAKRRGLVIVKEYADGAKGGGKRMSQDVPTTPSAGRRQPVPCPSVRTVPTQTLG